MKELKYKYVAKVHIKKLGDFAFIGTVKANTIKELKKEARKHARSWNEHGHRLYIECENTQREWVINS